MTKETQAKYWVFSNYPVGAYEDSIWDMSTILETNQYSFKKGEPNRKYVSPGDLVYLRIYSQSYIGRFVVGGEWAPVPDPEKKRTDIGTFPIHDLILWSRMLPQNLIMRDLSTGDYRHRITQITPEDGTMIETAQRVYERLGFGGADGEIVVLEKGLEEAIKPNLGKLGLTLAGKDICQQFSMGPGVGKSDLICTDQDGNLVVLELKRGMTSDETVGQVLRYVGWVRENIAEEGQHVHGWIVAGDYDEHLRLAASAANIRLLLVRLG